jgi:hypothetical protein
VKFTTRESIEMNAELEFYTAPGPMTDLSKCDPKLFEGLPSTPVGLMKVVRGCVTSGDHLALQRIAVPEGRGAEAGIKAAAAIIARIAELDSSPLVVGREPQQRIIGNCRTFATLSCALIRRAGVPARVRAGFAAYFRPHTWVDHWSIEYWRSPDDAWVRVDPELDDDWFEKNFKGRRPRRWRRACIEPEPSPGSRVGTVSSIRIGSTWAGTTGG